VANIQRDDARSVGRARGERKCRLALISIATRYSGDFVHRLDSERILGKQARPAYLGLIPIALIWPAVRNT
jgi:hypothetical protein